MFVQSDHPGEWDHYSDNELWTAFRQGYRDALSELFLRYYDILLRYGLKLISDHEATKDGIQQLFLRLWEKRKNIDGADSVKFYLLLSLRRILFREQNRDAARQKRNREYAYTRIGLFENVENAIIETELENEREELYRKALKKLTDRQKEILFLRLNHGLKNREIAKLTGLTHQRVRNYMSEAVSKLREQIFKDTDALELSSD